MSWLRRLELPFDFASFSQSFDISFDHGQNDRVFFNLLHYSVISLTKLGVAVELTLYCLHHLGNDGVTELAVFAKSFESIFDILLEHPVVVVDLVLHVVHVLPDGLDGVGGAVADVLNLCANHRISRR